MMERPPAIECPEKLNILSWDYELVDRKCAPIEQEEFNDELRKLAQKMFHVILHEYRGVGLAAPQCGIFRQMAVICVPRAYLKDAKEDLKLVLCNPKIEWYGEKIVLPYEGCLSLPGYTGRPRRSLEVTVSYQDEYGESMRITPSGYLAQIVQHEVDHLSGVFFIEHMSRVARNMIVNKHMKRVRKAIRKGAPDIKV